MDSNKRDYINYHLKRADEAIHDAKILIESESWNSCMNRLYYAAFYSVNALLFSQDIVVKTHSGARRMFDLHFIKTNRISKESGKLFSNLLNWRNASDYTVFIEFDKEIIVRLLQEVIDFVDEIKNKIS